MNMQEIERALRELRLSGIAATLSTRVMQAQSTQEPFLDTFAAMLQDELDQRRSRLTERRFKHSRLDERPTLADFDWRFNPKLPRQACFELHTLKFIGEGGNGVIVFFLQIDTVGLKNFNRDKHLQNRLPRTP